ncbi:MAG: hypothetical protein ABI718_05810 [Acidobacteriota bacterium]
MRKAARKRILAAVIPAVLAAGLLSCSGINNEVAPVVLIASMQQDVSLIDILNPPAKVGTINLQAIVKKIDADTRFLDVQLRRYQVSFRRTDGGTQIPSSFVRTVSGIIPVGGTPTALNDFLLLPADALREAPFAALLPQNGGHDPVTGKTTVSLDVAVEVFGETISGEQVSARTTAPFTFCAGCV